MNKSKVAALLLGLTAVSSTAFAATDADIAARQAELDAAAGKISGQIVRPQGLATENDNDYSGMAYNTGDSQARELGAEGFKDVPKGHWAYEAVDYLAKEGIIEGLGDGTFGGDKPLSRYEMAIIAAKAAEAQGLSYGDKLTVEKLQDEFGTEISMLKMQVESNTKEIAKLKSLADRVKFYGLFRVSWDHDDNQQIWDADTNKDKRFYLDLHADFKASDKWTVRFQSETDRHYARGTLKTNRNKMLRDLEKKAAVSSSSTTNNKYTVQYDDKESVTVYKSGTDANGNDIWKTADGKQLGEVLGIDWNNGNPFSFANQGTAFKTTDGTQYTASTNDAWTELTVTPYSGLSVTVPQSTSYYTDEVDDTGTIQRIWAEGNLGGGLHVDIGRRWRSLDMQNIFLGAETDGVVVDFPLTDRLTGDVFYQALSDHSWDNYDLSFYGLGVKGSLGNNFDVNLQLVKSTKGKYEGLEAGSHYGDPNDVGSKGGVISFAFNPARNLRFIFDYGRTDHDKTGGLSNEVMGARLNYKWADRQHPGSFGAYLRWINLGYYGDFGGDGEWESLIAGSKGWLAGFTYIPWKNVEWTTMYERASIDQPEGKSYDPLAKRHLWRTQLDIYF